MEFNFNATKMFNDNVVDLDMLLSEIENLSTDLNDDNSIRKRNLFIKVTITSLVTKFQVFVEDIFKEYRNKLNGKKFDDVTTRMLLNSIHMVWCGKNNNEQIKMPKNPFQTEDFKANKQSKSNMKNELYEFIRKYILFDMNSVIDNTNLFMNTKFPLGKTGKKELVDLFNQLNDDTWPERDFNDFDRLDSLLAIRHAIIHTDICNCTKEDVKDYIKFIIRLVNYIDEYLCKHVPK